MNRLLVLAASLLLAVLVVGLCVAQEKEEPKYWATFGVSIYLRDDSMEKDAKKELDAIYDSIGLDVAHPSWNPATTGWARNQRAKASPGSKAPAQRTEAEMLSVYTVICTKEITASQYNAFCNAFLAYIRNPKVDHGKMSSQISTAPIVKWATPEDPPRRK
jgi:hypothetical protein